MSDPWDELSIEQLHEYLHRDASPPTWVTTREPLRRAVVVHADTWRPWLDGHKALRTAWSDVAVATLDALVVADTGNLRHDPRRVDRHTLVSLSEALVAGPSDTARVRLLVATLLWGSGVSNGRGPRYTARALLDDRLVPALAASASYVADGSLANAHEGFRVRGIGPSFFTKWFWAVGLASAPTPKPLVLDRRVAACLYRLTGRTWQATGEAAAEHYVDYVTRLERWAHAIRQDVRLLGLDAEKLEWLLFDRDPNCLFDWLPPR